MFPCATPAARPLPNTQHVTLFVVCCHQGNAPNNIMLPACSHFRYAALTIVGDSNEERATLHAQHVDDRFKGAGIKQRWTEVTVNPTSNALQKALKKVVDFVSQRGQLAPACVVVYYSGPVALSHGTCKLCSNLRPPCACYSWHNMVCVWVCALSLAFACRSLQGGAAVPRGRGAGTLAEGHSKPSEVHEAAVSAPC